MMDLIRVVGSDERVVRVAYSTVSNSITEVCATAVIMLFCPIAWPFLPIGVVMTVARHKKPRAVLTDTWIHF